MTVETLPRLVESTDRDTNDEEYSVDDISMDNKAEHEKGNPELEEALRNLPEQLQSRVENAVDKCEFERSPEIEEAIKSYYADHYRSAMIIDHVVRGEAVDPSVLVNEDVMLESFQLTESLEKIITEQDRSKQLEKAHEFIGKKLFSEAAVGQTTVSEQEVGLALGLNEQLLQQAQSENVYIHFPNTDERVKENIERGMKRFWEDSRAAGQLEFHNTPFADEMAQANFKLRSKPNQRKTDGDYRSVTADVKGHSQSVHFSETFFTDSYKDVQAGNQVDHITIGGTVAVPLAEIVKQLPYARGGEYGVMALKPGAEDKSTVIEDANIFALDGHHNGGEVDDEPSKSGRDRTFYADKFSREKGEDYEINFGKAMGTSTGNTSSIIFLQRDIDHTHRKQFNENLKNVDARLDFGAGEGYPEVKILDFDYGDKSMLGSQFEMKPGKPFVDPNIAARSANAMGLIDPRLSRVATEHYSYREGVTPEQQAEELREAIQEMQRRSREHPDYKGKIVAMLRAGTMAYAPSA